MDQEQINKIPDNLREPEKLSLANKVQLLEKHTKITIFRVLPPLIILLIKTFCPIKKGYHSKIS